MSASVTEHLKVMKAVYMLNTCIRISMTAFWIASNRFCLLVADPNLNFVDDVSVRPTSACKQPVKLDFLNPEFLNLQVLS